jgi:hypothetical protein
MHAYRVSDDVIFRELENEAVLLDLSSGRYYGLNAVGTRVWTLMAGGTTVEAIVEALAAEFDADAARIAEDVGELLADLTTRGLVVPVPPTGAPAR